MLSLFSTVNGLCKQNIFFFFFSFFLFCRAGAPLVPAVVRIHHAHEMAHSSTHVPLFPRPPPRSPYSEVSWILSRFFNVVRPNSTIQSSTRWLRSTNRKLDASRGRATTNKNNTVSPQRKSWSRIPCQVWERYHHLWSRPTHRMNGGWIEVHSSTAIFAVNPAKPRVSSYRTLQWLAFCADFEIDSLHKRVKWVPQPS